MVREFGILPPGDVRNCLAALAPEASPFRDLLQHRFEGQHDLAAHPIGNLLANLMTKSGETEGYTLGDHLDVIRAHVGFDLFDFVLVNRRAVAPAVTAKYARRGCLPVARDERPLLTGATVVERDLAWRVDGGKIRHDPAPLAKAILELMPFTAGTSDRPTQTVRSPVLESAC